MLLCLTAAAIVGVASPAAAIVTARLTWVHQLSTSNDAFTNAFGVGVDSAGNSYVVGQTTGTLPGSPETNSGQIDAFLAKYDTTGTPVWVHQLDVGGVVYGNGVAVDDDGNSYITGSASGTLPGSPETNIGAGSDAFVAKYDTDGTELWVHQLGTTRDTSGGGVAVDGSGNVYVTGFTEETLPGSPEPNAGGDDIFVAKYDGAGTRLWVHQLGTSHNEYGTGVAVDPSGNIYVSGTMPGSPAAYVGFSDVFVAKYDAAGAKLWVQRLGTTRGEGYDADIAVDSVGNSYITGETDGTLPGSLDTNSGDTDAFLAKYDTAGTRLWVHQLDTTGPGEGFGVAVDTGGNSYITGVMGGRFPGAIDTNAGLGDVFVVKYDTAGTRQWTRQFGTTTSDSGAGVAIDRSNNVYVTGSTEGMLPGSTEANDGASAMFIAKLQPTSLPSPPTSVAAIGGDASVAVSFAPPTDDGGTPIIEYTASCRSNDGGAAGSTVAAVSTLSPDLHTGQFTVVVAGLTNSNTYTCTVAATTTSGTSAPSLESNQVIPAALPATTPESPTSVTAAGATLPETGGANRALALSGALILTLGLAAVMGSRRRLTTAIED